MYIAMASYNITSAFSTNCVGVLVYHHFCYESRFRGFREELHVCDVKIMTLQYTFRIRIPSHTVSDRPFVVIRFLIFLAFRSYAYLCSYKHLIHYKHLSCWFFFFSHDQTVGIQSPTLCIKHLCVFSLILYSDYSIIIHAAISALALSFWKDSPLSICMNRLCDWLIITIKHNK